MRFEWDALNIEHVAAHGLSPADVEAVYAAADFEFQRRGWTLRYTGHGTVDGVLYRVVFNQVAEDMLRPITCHVCDEKRYP